MNNKIIFIVVLVTVQNVLCFNGDDFELECPDECDCHYFRINWVTDCSESNLTAIPQKELSLSVYILDLDENNITDIDPFPKNIKLRSLQIADNLLTELKRQSFVGLEYLIDIDLSRNKIKNLDPESFSDSPGLLHIELQGNPLEHNDEPFLISNTLQYLDISSCGLSNITSSFFQNVTSLTTLVLSKNPLVALDAKVFEPLTVLETLNMNECDLMYLSDNIFSSLKVLKHLDLSFNRLTNTEWTLVLGNLVRLEFLNLRKSKITYLPEDSFYNGTYLQTLILAENELHDLDVATTLRNNVRHLDTLDLSNCHLNGPLSADAFANATKLKTLHLSGNKFSPSDLEDALQPLTRLETLSLSNCELEHLPDTFDKLKNLLELDISHNPLVDVFVKLLEPLEKLEYLNMGFSNLSHLGPDTFSKMTSMKRLVLSGNDLNTLEAGLFGNLTHLETMELDFCGLRRPLDANVFFKNLNYTELKVLKLAGNPLVIPKSGPLFPKQLSRIKRLDLSNCNITNLPDETFRNTREIKDLNLASNNLSSQTGSLKFLQYIPRLEILDLGNNNLTSITPQVFAVNPRIRSLRLVGNPWKCDCKVAEMWDWASMIKGDLHVLVGAKTIHRDIAIKSPKKKKGLICNYDENETIDKSTINKMVPGRRPFSKPREVTATNRTWAKYVRESGCEPVVKILKPVALMSDNIVDEYPVEPDLNFTWIVALVGVIIIFSTGALLALSISFSKKKVTDALSK